MGCTGIDIDLIPADEIIDDDDTGDDDTGDDDAGDDDSTDDDSTDDDTGDDDVGDDDTTALADPVIFGFSFAIDTSGGGAGGNGTLEMTVRAYDEDVVEICAQKQEFDLNHAYGVSQGDDFWMPLDEVIDWSGPGTTISDPCWWGVEDLWGEEWDTATVWFLNPLAFVSCEQVAGDGWLASLLLGEDVFGFENGVLTFGELCDVVGPQLQQTLGTGPMEGIWMTPMSSGDLDNLGTFEYYEPVNPNDVATWGLFGYLMNDIANTPATGLDGHYYTISPWLLHASVPYDGYLLANF